MPFCPSCGTEHQGEDQFCRNCGEAIGQDPSGELETNQNPATDTDESEDWSFFSPEGPFQSPRTALNYFNTGGLLLIIIAILFIGAGVESPYAHLPDPLPILVIVYLLAVIFVGIPIWFVLLLTDNVLGFLRHG